MTAFDRDATTVDALLTDLYLDALLAGIVGAAKGDPSMSTGDRLDPAVRAASDRLRRDLVRVHPSFRFEERLATRLAEAALALRMPAAAGAEGVVPFRSGAGATGRLLLDHPDDPDGDPSRHDRARPLLIGGALTSAALSLAGAALVAWRLARPGRGATPMARAARAVRVAHDATRITGRSAPVGVRRTD